MNGVSALVLLRRLWLGAAVGIAAIATLVVVAADARPPLPEALPALLVAAAGVGAVIGAIALDRVFAATPPGTDADALAELRQRAYLAVGIAEAPLLLAVAVAFALGPGWVAAIGGAAGLAVLAVARPTTGRIRRIEGTWQAAGTDISILRAAEAADDADTER